MSNNTIEKMNFKELLKAYDAILQSFRDSKYTPDDTGYIVIEKRLQNIENEIEERKPGYLESLETEKEYANILDDNYTIEQFSAMFNISRQTVYNWIKENKFSVMRIGRKMYISKKVIEKMLQGGVQ